MASNGKDSGGVDPRKRRAGYRGALTRHCAGLDEFIETANLAELSAQLDALTDTYAKISELNDQVLDKLTDEAEIEAECMDTFERKKEYFQHCARLRAAIDKLKGPRPGGDRRAHQGDTVKLPKLSLPRFGGKLVDWLSFWEVFQSAMNDSPLDAVRKFYYLKGQLDGEAQQLIEGFAVTGDSYEEAVQLLQATYGDTEQLKVAHVLALLDIKEPHYKPGELSKFRAEMECHTRSLDTLNLTLEEMIVIILRQKLPLAILDKVRSFQLDEFKTELSKEIVNLQLSNGKGLATSVDKIAESRGGTLNLTLGSKGKGEGAKSKPQIVCKFCTSRSHKWSFCPKYPSNAARIARARKLKLCTSCLSADHRGKCSATYLRDCRSCSGRHFDKLCPGTTNEVTGTSQNTVTPVKNENPTASLNVEIKKESTILPTVQIPMKRKRGNGSLYCRVLLDQGSQRSFIKRELLNELDHAIVGTEALQLQGFTGTIERKDYQIARVSYTYHKQLHHFTCVVVDVLPDYRSSVGVKNVEHALRKRGLYVSDPVGDSKDVCILLGADYYYNVVYPGYRRECGIIIIPTRFGYAMSGKVAAPQSEALVETVSVLRISNTGTDIGVECEVASHDPNVDFNLERLWKLDHIGINPDEIDLESKLALQQFEDTVRYDVSEGQYEVGLPWKDRSVKLPSNYGLALGRLRALQRRLTQDPVTHKAYDNVFQDYLNKGFIEEINVNDVPTGGRVHYLAHHGVKKDSVTTPIRVVYDCSARVGAGPSLNDCLLSGPSFVADLSQQLLRFRLGTYACLSDIEKAFLMVRLREEDRDVTRFLWVRDVSDPDSEVIGYRFCVVLFGATCSQFLLNATVRKHLESATEDTAKLSRGLYIDNLQGSCDNQSELVEFYWQARRLFAEAHLNLREWVTNSPSLREHLEIDGTAASNQDKTKNLGMVWHTQDDKLAYPPKEFSCNPAQTKRGFLSEAAQLFDPLGLLLPVTIRARLVMQELWRRKLSWDEPLPEDLQGKCADILSDYNNVSSLRVSRMVANYGSVTLHTFCDASASAYGAAVFVATSEGTTLLTARAKVAPVKGLTVPKMELTAMLLLARLIGHICTAYNEELRITSIHVWCDSKVTLNWVHSKKALPVYVRNRVDEIRSLLPDAIYHYVSTKENPSDLLTRGVTASHLLKSDLWWHGPSWLSDQSQWTVWDSAGAEDPITETVSVTPLATQEPADSIIDWRRFGGYNKLVRVVAWVKRFCDNTAKSMKNEQCNKGQSIDAVEFKAAEVALIKWVQKESYPEVLASLSDSKHCKLPNIVRQLHLRLDEGLIRCQGRLQESDVSVESNNPVLMPTNHHVTDLLVLRTHETVMHFGVHHVVSTMRLRWWIPRIRQVVRKVTKKCVKCLRLKGKPYSTGPPPPLPDYRVKDVNPFEHVGLDYTGAFRTREQEKVYVLLFTCATTRAVHLELCDSMSNEDFMLALRRFCARRSFPSLIVSDNAPTFHQASNYLKDLSEDPKVVAFVGNNKCEWRTIPVNAPWFGGMWERCVGIVKSGLKAVVGRALLSKSELNTVLIEVEAAVNSRPLTYVYTDLNEPLPLTPAHLLYGRSLSAFPSDDLTDDEFNDPTVLTHPTVTRRYQYISRIIGEFKRRWMNEYLLALRERSINKFGKPSAPSVGDIVLLRDDGSRLYWRMGRVTKLHAGGDSVERVASVETANGTTLRPIARLYKLELHTEVPTDNAGPEGNNHDTPEDVHPRVGTQSRQAAGAARKMWRHKIASGQL